MVVGYVIEEEVQMINGSHLTTDLRLTGGDMIYSTSWDTSIPLVCGGIERFHCSYMYRVYGNWRVCPV